MGYLFTIYETYTNAYSASFINILSLLAIFCGIMTIISKNPIISILFLIGLFGSISSYLIFLGFNFIGLSYLIVYIGAVSILFIFILMLINIRTSELQSNTNNSMILGFVILAFLNLWFLQLLPCDVPTIIDSDSYINILIYGNNTEIYSNIYDSNILLVTDKLWDGNLIEFDHITSIGNVLYANYNIWLIITSIILLLAMVGAIVITIKQKN